MGLLQQNMKRFTIEYYAAGGFISGETLLKWFKGKVAEARTMDEFNTIQFEAMSAVVMVGVSGSGKTHFAHEFVKTHPGFILCSHDECYGKAMIDFGKLEGEDVDARMYEYLERMLRSAKKRKQSVILDGLFVSPVVRAAVLNTLRDYGFKIHVVYITISTVAKNANEYFFKRAVEMQVFRHYCLKHKELTAQRAITLRRDAVKMYCEENGITVDELYESYKNDPVIMADMEKSADAALFEIDQQVLKQQEITGAVMLGADYYYEF